MNCKYLKTMTKKCSKLNKKIAYKDCVNCEYRSITKINKPINKMKNKSKKLAKLEKNRFSIIYSDLTKCCNCGSKVAIEKNEIFEGAYRQTSIKHGMVAPFCNKCHKRFHNDIMFNLFYKVMFEKEYLKNHTKEEFIKTFGQDYIFKLNKLQIKKER